MKATILSATVITSCALLLVAEPATAQLLPQVWGSVGVKDSEATFSVGARALGLGAELGLSNESAVGVDILKFINPPLVNQISGYVGIGLYDSSDSGSPDIALSGGVQVFPSGNLFFGAGYHTIRGINGQIGFKLF